MRRHGINYDTGFTPIGEEISRQDFDPGVVRREMRIIADELHCDAVRVSGGDPDRLSTAAEAAAAAGLEVWFAPFPAICGPTHCATSCSTARTGRKRYGVPVPKPSMSPAARSPSSTTDSSRGRPCSSGWRC